MGQQSATLDPYWTESETTEVVTVDPPKKERTVNWEKIIEHFRRGTVLAANALEDLIVDLSKQGWDDEALSMPRAKLVAAREHLAGYLGPMRWRTMVEAERYMDEQNEGSLTEKERFCVIGVNGTVDVQIPRA